MTAASIGRVAASPVALVAACSAALVLGVTIVRHEVASETGATAPPPFEQAASDAQDEGSPPQAPETGAAATPARTFRQSASDPRDEGSPPRPPEGGKAANAAQRSASPPSSLSDEIVPAFDLTRIERTGEAVIAGRAAPGAVVDLLRNGERLDEAVANSSGQFVIVPPRLPPGSYELALTSRSPDGTLATSKKGVAVAIDEITARPGTPRSGTESIADTARAKEPERAGMSSQAQLLSQPASHVLKRQVGAAARVSRARPAMADGGSSSPASKTFTKIVSRGDSLWRISRLTYGDGSRYAVVYSANRDRIRDPNVILPGQILSLPTKAR